MTKTSQSKNTAERTGKNGSNLQEIFVGKNRVQVKKEIALTPQFLKGFETFEGIRLKQLIEKQHVLYAALYHPAGVSYGEVLVFRIIKVVESFLEGFGNEMVGICGDLNNRDVSYFSSYLALGNNASLPTRSECQLDSIIYNDSHFFADGFLYRPICMLEHQTKQGNN